jgi:hypothetical protein
LSSARTKRPASDFADLVKWGLMPSSSKDRPKPIVAKARKPPRRGGANEDRRNEAGDFARGHMASFMEEALVAQLERAEKKRGEPFPSRAGAALKTGRPIEAA